MDQPPAVALTAFVDAWPRAIETEIGAALCAIGAGRTLTFLTCFSQFISAKVKKISGSISRKVKKIEAQAKR